MSVEFDRMGYRKEPLPPIEDLLKEASRIYRYNEETGDLIWKEYTIPRAKGKIKLGSVVGGDDGHGYRMCALLGHKFKVHQVVWLMCHKKLPDHPIDHIDGNKRNNRIDNLRPCKDFQNVGNNVSLQSDTCGICRSTKGTKWEARIGFKNKRIYLGRFETEKEARAAYVGAAKALREEYSPV